MTKVLQVIGRLNVGGPAVQTVLLAHLLDPSRFETVLVAGREGPNEGSMRYLAEERGVALTIVNEMSREVTPRNDVVALFKLIGIMRREKPDVIHTHTAKAGALGRVAAMIALAGRRKRIYHTFHGHVFDGYFDARRTRTFVHIERWLARFTRQLIAVSGPTRDDLLRLRIAPPSKIAVIPLGLDLEQFEACSQKRGELRRELNIPAGALVIGLVARLVPIKRPDVFLHSAERLSAGVPDTHFVLAGDGELRPELEALTERLGIRDRVRFLGFRKDLDRIYADLDMVALSSHSEGLPVSLIEAMAAGCVVVSTAVGGVPDLVDDGATGYLAPTSDAAGLVAAMRRAVRERAQWPEVTSRARASVLARYRVGRLVSDMEALYAA